MTARPCHCGWQSTGPTCIHCGGRRSRPEPAVIEVGPGDVVDVLRDVGGLPSLGEALGQGALGCLRHDTPPGPCRLCAVEGDLCFECGVEPRDPLFAPCCSGTCREAWDAKARAARGEPIVTRAR